MRTGRCKCGHLRQAAAESRDARLALVTKEPSRWPQGVCWELGRGGFTAGFLQRCAREVWALGAGGEIVDKRSCGRVRFAEELGFSLARGGCNAPTLLHGDPQRAVGFTRQGSGERHLISGVTGAKYLDAFRDFHWLGESQGVWLALGFQRWLCASDQRALGGGGAGFGVGVLLKAR